jgi:putative transposase
MRPPDLVTRRFTGTRPNQRWVADLTYVVTWRRFVAVAFVIGVFWPGSPTFIVASQVRCRMPSPSTR